MTPDTPENAAERAIEFISAHFSEKIAVSDIAGAAGLSTFHFTRMFRETTGESPYQYLLRVRIDRAKLLLVEDAHPSIEEISIAVGFSNQGHFSRHFKRIAGKTPSSFRHEQRRPPN